MNVLFLTEVAPFPPNGGEKLRSYGLLKLMSELKLNVHAVTGSAPSNTAAPDGFKGIRFYPYNFAKNKSDSRIIRYRNLFTCDRELLTLLNRILQQNKIDVIFIDYFFYGQYISFFRKKGIPVIYGTHNAQAHLIYQIPAVSLRNKITKQLDNLVYKFHEFYFFRKADALLVVSENDKKYHQAFVNKNKIFVIPNFLIESEYSPSPRKKENYIIMTANFYAYQNAFGFEWFVKEVWNKELWNKIELYLIGINSMDLYNSLKEKYTMTNIKAIGEVKDLKPYISNAKVSIVPLLHGSGSRLKCLESMALKTQLISTTKGAEGIDHNHSFILADTPGDFKKALLDIIDSKTDYTEKAYQAFLAKYSLIPNMKIFTDVVRHLKIADLPY